MVARLPKVESVGLRLAAQEGRRRVSSVAKIRSAPIRKLIVCDRSGRWYVRRVKLNHQDDARGEMIYHCDQHLSGPHMNLLDVPEVKDAMARKRR